MLKKLKMSFTNTTKPESFLTILDFPKVLDHSSSNLHNQNMCSYHQEKLASYCKIKQLNLGASLIQIYNPAGSKQIRQQGLIFQVVSVKIIGKLCRNYVTLDQ